MRAGGGHRPRRRFGQHFLHDPAVVRRILAAVDPRPDEDIVEIGPGEGVLTRPLAASGARLHLIEIDRDLAARLAAAFDPARVSLHVGDATRFDFAVLPAGARLVGNLPYNVSTPILFRVAAGAERFRDAHFMLQREVVERMVAPPSGAAYGRLSVMLALRFRMEKLFLVGPGAFRPPPRVESAVVRLVPLSPPPVFDEAALSVLVARAFSARRKRLTNALGIAAERLRALGLDPAARPENLAPADYLRIAACLPEMANELPGQPRWKPDS